MSETATASGTQTALPARLHHNAHVTDDQEATRRFYEDLVGLPLIATWTEVDVLFGKSRTYCHTFYGLADGSALAFFQFADPLDQEFFGPRIPQSPFMHIALRVTQEVQSGISARLADAEWNPAETFVLEHGYCRSLYTRDPNGLLLEFTVDRDEVEEINAERLKTAHADLRRWLGGDHGSNNTYR